jgi:four helix bundle protein
MQDHRKLRVWRKAHINVLRARKATSCFPAGYTNLKKQLTRSVESVAFNIVEGCGAAWRKEFARFLEISIKSSNELEYQLALASDYGILPAAKWRKLTAKTVDIRKMLCGLREKLLREDAKRVTGYARRDTGK